MRHLLLTFFFGAALSSHAQVISEIFPSPSSKQWIEIYNNTEEDIDLLNYKILDSAASINGHAISAVSGSGVLPAGALGIVAKDPSSVLAPYLFKSALGIKVTGDSITLKSGGVALNAINFPDGSSAVGNSYQNTDSGWIFSAASPGSFFLGISTTTTESTNSQESPILSTPLSSHYSFVPISENPTSKFIVGVGRDRLGYVGIPLFFQAMVNTDDPNTSYFWTFGDGSSGSGKNAQHTYLYAGTYTIVLNAELLDNEAVARAVVKVISPELEIVEANNFFIGIKNKSKYEINLYGWKIDNNTRIFEFPRDTIISASETINFPATVTNLFPIDKTQVVINETARLIVVPQDKILISDQEKQKIIEEISLKLSHTLKQLADLENRDEVITMQSESFSSQSQVASVVESVSPPVHSWFVTLRQFFIK